MSNDGALTSDDALLVVTAAAVDRQRKRHALVKKACNHCFKSKTKCSEERPCKRCVTKGLAMQCVDRPMDEEHSGGKRKRVKVTKIACSNCKAAKACCDEQAVCARCEKIGLRCVRFRRGHLVEGATSLTVVKSGSSSSEDEIQHSSPVVPSPELWRNHVNQCMVRAPYMYVQAAFPLQYSIPTQIIQSPAFETEAMFNKMLFAMESLSPLQLGDFVKNSNSNTFNSFVAVLILYLSRKQAAHILQKMRSFSLDLHGEVSGSNIRGALPLLQERRGPSLDDAFVEPANKITAAFVSKSQTRLDFHDVQREIDSIPFTSLFPLKELNLLGRPIAVVYIRFLYLDDSVQNVHFTCSINRFAEELLGYTALEFSEMCTVTSAYVAISDEVAFAPLLNIFHRDDRPKFPSAVFENFSRGPCVMFLRLLTRIGVLVPCYALCYNAFDDQGRPINFVCGCVPLNSHEKAVIGLDRPVSVSTALSLHN